MNVRKSGKTFYTLKTMVIGKREILKEIKTETFKKGCGSKSSEYDMYMKLDYRGETKA